MKEQVGTYTEREVRIGTVAFLVIVMQLNNTSRYLVLNENGQTVKNGPFVDHIEDMIRVLTS